VNVIIVIAFSLFTSLLYILIVECKNAHRRRREQREKQMRKIEKQQFKASLRDERNKIFQKLIPLYVRTHGFSEYKYLGKDDTAEYSYDFEKKEFIRISGVGEIVSKRLSNEEHEAMNVLKIDIWNFIHCWQNGFVIQSPSLKDHRVIAMCGTLVLTAKVSKHSWPVFAIWTYEDNLLFRGRSAGEQFVEAKKVFACLLTNDQSQYDGNADYIALQGYTYEEIKAYHLVEAVIPVNSYSVYPPD